MTQSSIKSDSRIDLANTINDTLAQWPSSIRVFHNLRIHTCCDGALTLEAAAVKSNVEPQLLAELLSDAIAAERTR